MQSKTTIYITLNQTKTWMLTFHPYMTTSELQELVRASFLLCGDVPTTTSKTQRQAFLLTQSRNLITDYLLTSTSCPLAKICRIEQKYSLFNKYLYEIKSHHALQNYIKNPKTDQKASTLNLQIIYPESQNENTTTFMHYQCLDSKKKNLIQRSDEKILEFQREVGISKENNSFCQRIKFRKQNLKSYPHFQSLMLIRQRLIKSTQNHSNIFEELTSTYEDKQNLVFQLNYVPSIRITQILKFSLEQQQKTRIVEKVLVFLHCLRCNGFQQYLATLQQMRKITSLLDKISVDFNLNIHITDPTIILEQEQNSNFKMRKDQLGSLEFQTQRYLSTLNPLHNQVDHRTISVQQVFIQLFSSKRYKFSVSTSEKYNPECNFFFWSSILSQSSFLSYINEGTTIKKKINKQEQTKKRVKSQKTKPKYNVQSSEPHRREKKSSKRQNRSFT